MLAPAVVAEPPAGWVAADVAEPPLTGAADARVTSWRASRSATASAVLVSGCVSAPIPGWVDDMRDPVLARATGLVAATCERIAGGPVELRRDGADAFVVHAAGGGARLGAARTLLGFDDAHVATCFAACVAPAAASTGPDAACDAAVARATLVGGAPPPPPGAALAALAFCVHHPRRTAGGAGALTVAAGVLAVASRRRPRSRI